MRELQSKERFCNDSGLKREAEGYGLVDAGSILVLVEGQRLLGGSHVADPVGGLDVGAEHRSVCRPRGAGGCNAPGIARGPGA